MGGPPQQLASAQDEFLRRSRAAGHPGATEWTVLDGTGAERRVRAWRIDVSVSLAGQSFLLTTDGEWCTGVRIGDAKFGWQIIPPEQLPPTVSAWVTDLTRELEERQPPPTE